MSTDRDVTRIVRSWLHEDAHEDADRILNLVLDEIDTTPQRRAGWLARRFPIMNTYLKFGLAAAVVVLAAFIGYQLLPGGSNFGGPGPSPSVAPSASASAAEQPTPAGGNDVGPFALSDGTLGGGSPMTVTISAPGWYGDPNGGVLCKNADGCSDPPAGAGMTVFGGQLYVYGDPCQWSSTTPDTPATTVDEVVAALTAQASRDASAPVDVTVGGYAGKSITLHVPDDAVLSACNRSEFRSWVADPVADSARYHQGPGQIDELWIVDVDGVLTVIDAGYYARTPAEHVAELRAMVDSITFELP